MSADPNIVVNAVIEADQAVMDALWEPLLTMQAASRAEDGCQDYTFSVELGNPESVRITERWDDRASLVAHFGTEHMVAFQQAMAANPPRSVNAAFYEVTEIDRPS